MFIVLHECLGDSLCSHIETHLKDHMTDLANNLAAFKPEIYSRQPKFFNIHRDHLPVFRLVNSSKFVTAKSCDYFVLEASQSFKLLPLDPRVRLIDLDPNHANLVLSLKLKKYPLSSLIEKSVDYYAAASHESNPEYFAQLLSILEWTFNSEFEGKLALVSNLLGKSIYRNRSTNDLRTLESIYDPEDRFVKALVPAELVLNSDLHREPFYSIIKRCLATRIDVDYLVEFIEAIKPEPREIHLESVRLVLDYLSEHHDLQTVLFGRIRKLRWLPAFDKTGLFSPSELWRPKSRLLLGKL